MCQTVSLCIPYEVCGLWVCAEKGGKFAIFSQVNVESGNYTELQFDSNNARIRGN